jgi:Mor family transcriptional regulator
MSGVRQSSLDLLLVSSEICKLANRYLGSREYYLPIGRDSMNELRNPINLEQKVTV